MQFRQFSIARNATLPVTGWRQFQLPGYTLSCPTTVPIHTITRANQLAGVVIGWAVYAHALLVKDSILELGSACMDHLRNEACGRFVVVRFEAPGEISISTDGSGLFPVVFDIETNTIASSPAILNKFRPLSKDPCVALDIRRSDGTCWYPFGWTPHLGIRRLLPSQKIRLRSEDLRVSDTAPLLNRTDTSVSPAELCDRVSGYIKSWARSGPLVAHLTAGYDSRMIMAAILKSNVDAEFITLKGKSASTDLDVHVAAKIAKSMRVIHRTLNYIPPSPTEIADWQERVGHCIRDAVMDLCASAQKFSDHRITLTGACGEVGRAAYWHKDDLQSSGLTPPELLQRLGFQNTPLLTESARVWLERFPSDIPRSIILDNAYIDLRLGCWAGPSMPGHNTPCPAISPFNSIRLFQAMLAIPEESRFSQTYAQEFIRSASPKLLNFGFNVASGWSRLRFLKHEIRNILPKPARSKVREFVKRWELAFAKPAPIKSSITSLTTP